MGLMQLMTELGEKEVDRRIYGVAVAQVINNVDVMNLGRVQLMLPWLPGYQPWARVVTMMAGFQRGTYFMPQIGEEVLVAFHHGDVREPYVLGGMWNTIDRPPSLAPTDAVNKRIIRTPLGHEIEFDDALQSITITSTTKQKVTIDPTQIQLETVGGAAKVTLETIGKITIESGISVDIKAPTVKIEADLSVEIKSKVSAELNGGANCKVKAGLVEIN